MKEIVEVLLAEDLLRFVPENPLDDRTGIRVQALGVHLPDPFPRVFDNLTEPLFRLAQRLLHAPTLGDVPNHTDRTARHAIRVLQYAQ